MAMVKENDRAIQELRGITDLQRDGLYQVSAMALEATEYVQSQKAAIREIEEMLPPERTISRWLSPNTKRLFKIVE